MRVPGRRTHDEERVVAPHLLADVDLHDDLVVARPPRRVDVERERDRPAAPLRGRVLRRLVLVGRDRVGTEHDLPSRADPCHLDAHRPPARRRHVQTDLLARAHRLRPAVPRHHFAPHLPTLTGPITGCIQQGQAAAMHRVLPSGSVLSGSRSTAGVYVPGGEAMDRTRLSTPPVRKPRNRLRSIGVIVACGMAAVGILGPLRHGGRGGLEVNQAPHRAARCPPTNRRR